MAWVKAALLADVNAALAEHQMSLQSMLQKSAEALVRHMGAAFARIWTLNPKESLLELQASAGMYTHLNGKHSRVPVGEFKIGLIAQEREPHLTNDVVNDPRVSDKEWARAEGMVAFAGYPLLVEDRVVGVMAMFARHLLPEDTIEAIATVAAPLAQGIERKRAEEAQRRSEQHARRQLAQLQAIYATAPVGLCILDTDLRFLRINEVLAEIDGKSMEEYLGRTVREVVPEVADEVESDLWRVVETGEPVLNTERRFALPAQPGVRRDFIASFYPIKNGSGRVLGVNIVVIDITQRKKIEEKLEQLLRQEKVAREEAEAANRMKDEFLTTISHELRTPLTAILGWARMLTGGKLTGTQARHAMEVIERSAQSQTRLVEDVLDTSRIITGSLKLDAQPVPIEHVFHAAVDVIRPSAEAKGIALSEAVDEPDGVVLGDANRLQQVIWNLLSNAVKFTDEGGRVEARLGRAEGQIDIAVSDTGIGIDPGFLHHVFDRFSQADSTSTREYGGLGIGLAITRHIVEMHGGRVSASSPGKGQGATFKIRLPLISASRLTRPEGLRVEAPTTTPLERKISENGHRLDGVRVLLVEDNPDTLDVLKFIFYESGAEVLAATSVDEALGALERFSPDVLVSDLAMPGRDGYELIREVRSREIELGRKIPAVAVTAYARGEDRMRALSAGYQMHIVKPIVPEELIVRVASLTGRI